MTAERRQLEILSHFHWYWRLNSKNERNCPGAELDSPLKYTKDALKVTCPGCLESLGLLEPIPESPGYKITKVGPVPI